MFVAVAAGSAFAATLAACYGPATPPEDSGTEGGTRADSGQTVDSGDVDTGAIDDGGTDGDVDAATTD